jgi:hypothetical protein
LAAGQSELDSFDIVNGLVIRGGIDVEILNGISLHGGLCVSWPRPQITAKITVPLLIEHWRTFGRPTYVQFDNDTIFQGAHQFADSFGRVIRLCLSLDVTPVFAPPRETGFQAAIENYNGRWQAKAWSRFQHRGLRDLCGRSRRFVDAARQRAASRIEAAPERLPFPAPWKLNLRTPLRGRVIFLRRSDPTGRVVVLGHTYFVSPTWVHRLVRADVNLDAGQIGFHALRRRDPTHQPLLATVNYQPPEGAFHE